MITVGVACLAAMESVVRFLVHGLLDDKMNGFVVLVMVILTLALLLVHFVGVAVLVRIRHLLNNNLVVLLHAVKVTRIEMLSIHAFVQV